VSKKTELKTFWYFVYYTGEKIGNGVHESDGSLEEQDFPFAEVTEYYKEEGAENFIIVNFRKVSENFFLGFKEHYGIG